MNNIKSFMYGFIKAAYGFDVQEQNGNTSLYERSPYDSYGIYSKGWLTDKAPDQYRKDKLIQSLKSIIAQKNKAKVKYYLSSHKYNADDNGKRVEYTPEQALAKFKNNPDDIDKLIFDRTEVKNTNDLDNFNNHGNIQKILGKPGVLERAKLKIFGYK